MLACRRFCGFGWESEVNLSVIYLLALIHFFDCQAKVRVTFEVRLTDLEEACFHVILEAFKSRGGLRAAAGERWLFGQNGNENVSTST